MDFAQLPRDLTQAIEERWEKQLPYYKKRGGVIFLSYCRYWEQHGFVQQSLARFLVEHGIPVYWVDGMGWRPYKPTLYFQHTDLRVGQLWRLPGERLTGVKWLNWRGQKIWIEYLLRKLGGNPVVWVQAGIDEGLADLLPYIDVFSTFDDPYRHKPGASLCEKARLILCQNSFTYDLLKDAYSDKAKYALPPVDLRPQVFEEHVDFIFPHNFPSQVMGYIGSFFSDGFDLFLFENFVRSFPDWGFLVMGRTDEAGKTHLKKLTTYKNFVHLPWVPRAHIAAAWKKLKLSLLFYRPNPTQDGAFPTKILESLYFGVPCLATQVPKTKDLEGFCPRSPFPDRLKQLVHEVSKTEPLQLTTSYHHFAFEMNPKIHLARAGEWLRG